MSPLLLLAHYNSELPSCRWGGGGGGLCDDDDVVETGNERTNPPELNALPWISVETGAAADPAPLFVLISSRESYYYHHHIIWLSACLPACSVPPSFFNVTHTYWTETFVRWTRNLFRASEGSLCPSKHTKITPISMHWINQGNLFIITNPDRSPTTIKRRLLLGIRTRSVDSLMLLSYSLFLSVYLMMMILVVIHLYMDTYHLRLDFIAPLESQEIARDPLPLHTNNNSSSTTTPFNYLIPCAAWSSWTTSISSVRSGEPQTDSRPCTGRHPLWTCLRCCCCGTMWTGWTGKRTTLTYCNCLRIAPHLIGPFCCVYFELCYHCSSLLIIPLRNYPVIPEGRKEVLALSTVFDCGV